VIFFSFIQDLEQVNGIFVNENHDYNVKNESYHKLLDREQVTFLLSEKNEGNFNEVSYSHHFYLKFKRNRHIIEKLSFVC